jgi:hypothetical protein
MALQVYRINLTGYVIRDPDVMDDPNNIDFDVVMAMVLENSHECTMELVDSTDGEHLIKDAV